MKNLLLVLVALSSASVFAGGVKVIGRGTDEVQAISNAHSDCYNKAYAKYSNYNTHSTDVYRIYQEKKTNDYVAVGVCFYSSTDD